LATAGGFAAVLLTLGLVLPTSVAAQAAAGEAPAPACVSRPTAGSSGP